MISYYNVKKLIAFTLETHNLWQIDTMATYLFSTEAVLVIMNFIENQIDK